MTERDKAIAADKVWSAVDTILTVSERAGTTEWLKTVAVYLSYDDWVIVREALNEASNRWYTNGEAVGK